MKLFCNNLFKFIPLAAISYVLILMIWGNGVPADFRFNLNHKGSPGHMFTRLREVRERKNVDVLILGSSHAFRGFDPRIFAQNIGNAFSVRQGLDRSSIRGDANLLRKAGEQIARAIDPLPRQRDIIDSMRPYLDTLIKCLSTENRINPYLDKLTSFVLEKASALATLNYDTTIEESFERKKFRMITGCLDGIVESMSDLLANRRN